MEEAGTTWGHICSNLDRFLVLGVAANQGFGGEAGKWGDDDGRESGVEQRTPCCELAIMLECIENCQNWTNQMCERFKEGKEPAAEEYPPLPPCNECDGGFADGGDADEHLGGNYEAVPLKQSDLDPVHHHHHLDKVSMANSHWL